MIIDSLEPGNNKPILTIGEEFVNWAEQYWGLKIHYEQPIDQDTENIKYEYVKDIFSYKINQLIKDRLSL